MTDATAEDLLDGWKRELKSFDVDTPKGRRTLYYYDPPSVSELAVYYRNLRVDERGAQAVDLDGMVDSIIARVKTADSRPMFRKIHRQGMMEWPRSVLAEIWRGIGGDGAGSFAELAEAAEKK